MHAFTSRKRESLIEGLDPFPQGMSSRFRIGGAGFALPSLRAFSFSWAHLIHPYLSKNIFSAHSTNTRQFASVVPNLAMLSLKKSSSTQSFSGNAAAISAFSFSSRSFMMRALFSCIFWMSTFFFAASSVSLLIVSS